MVPALLAVMLAAGPISLDEFLNPTVDTPKPASMDDCEWIERVVDDVSWYWQLDDPEQKAEWDELCPQIVPYFSESYVQRWYPESSAGGVADQIHALAVVQCESGFDTYANTRRWGKGTQGLWSFMLHLNWPERLGFPWLDVFDTRDASFLASFMVYADVNPRVDPPNFWWWWSCSRHYQRALRPLGIRVPEASYCPPSEYWKDVRPGSGVAARADCGA